MKKLIALSIALSATFYAQAQNFIWVDQMGGISGDIGRSICTDVLGNVYTTGYFNGTADFDSGAGIFNLTSVGGQDIFITKTDISGNFVWAKQLGGAGLDFGQSITVDAVGNTFVTGYFSLTADFDPGIGTFNFTSAGGSDIFVLGLDVAGNFVWAKQMGGTSPDLGLSIALDAVGNVCTTGYFDATVDFDPGVGIFTLTSLGNQDIYVSKLDAAGNFIWAKQLSGSQGENGQSISTDGSNIYLTGYFNGTTDFDPGVGIYNLTTSGNSDIFVSELDANGNFVWAKQIGGITGIDYGISITLDGMGNFYVTGYFNGTVDFDPGVGITNLISAGAQDIFLLKLDASGNFIWAKQMGGPSVDFGLSVVVDGTGIIYTTGWFNGTVDFNPGAGSYNLTSAGSNDIFVSAIDANGNFIWAGQIGGVADDRGYGIAAFGSCINTTGYFSGTSDFDPSIAVYNLNSVGNTDIFVQKMCDIALPIEWFFFETYQSEKGIELKWITIGEIDLDRFEIQRSINGADWESFDELKASNNSDQLNRYTYVDDKFSLLESEIIYYRIKKIDVNGQESYSEAQSVYLSIPDECGLFLQNPCEEMLDGTLFLKSETVININILNLQGQLIKSEKINGKIGVNPIKISLNEVATGMYLLLLFDKRKTRTIKFYKN